MIDNTGVHEGARAESWLVYRDFRIDENKLNIKMIRNIVRRMIRMMRASIRKIENPFHRNSNYISVTRT